MVSSSEILRPVSIFLVFRAILAVCRIMSHHRHRARAIAEGKCGVRAGICQPLESLNRNRNSSHSLGGAFGLLDDVLVKEYLRFFELNLFVLDQLFRDGQGFGVLFTAEFGELGVFDDDV